MEEGLRIGKYNAKLCCDFDLLSNESPLRTNLNRLLMKTLSNRSDTGRFKGYIALLKLNYFYFSISRE